MITPKLAALGLILTLIALPVSGDITRVPSNDASNNTFTGTNTFTKPILLPDGTAGAPSWAWSSDADGTGTGMFRNTGNEIGVSLGGSMRAKFWSGGIVSDGYTTTTNCSSSAAPAVCSTAAAGSVVIAAAGTTVTVNTARVTANSQVFVQEDSSLGTKLSVTCNVVTGRTYTVTARTAGTSFVITSSAAPATNPACLSFFIVN